MREIFYNLLLESGPQKFYNLDQLHHRLTHVGFRNDSPASIEIHYWTGREWQIIAMLQADFKFMCNFDKAMAEALNLIPAPALVRNGKTVVLRGALLAAGKLGEFGKIATDKGVVLKMVELEVNDFCTEPLVSLGEHTFQDVVYREGIILSQTSSTLNGLYNAVKDFIIKNKFNTEEALQYLMQHIRNIFEKTAEKEVQKLVQTCRNKDYFDTITSPEGKTCYLILLQVFVAKKTGNCRHVALLSCYLIAHLIQANCLELSEVRHARGRIPTGGHSWAMIRDLSGEWILFDALAGIIARMNDPKPRERLCQLYSKETLDSIMDRLNGNEPEESQSLTLPNQENLSMQP